jgi:hypothetical protein
MHQPTSEQQAIIDAAKGRPESIMIDAYAGCAKTTTIEMCARALPVRPSLYVVFAVKNKKEAEGRMPTHFNVKTINGLGHEAWGRAIGKRCAVEQDKIGTILKEVVKNNREYADITRDQFGDILRLVRRARIAGLIPKQFERNDLYQYHGLVPDDDSGWQDLFDSLYMEENEGMVWIAREVLLRSITMSFAGTIDYDDQIYMSALFGGVFTRYPIVMVDEAQDLSTINHMMIAKTAADRLIVVGDPFQAIYAFRGADSSSMERLRDLRETWIDLPLSLTFRCPKAVVARQQDHAPGFTAYETNEEGEIHNFGSKEWRIDEIEKIADGRQIAILCRNNAPLLACALRIIKSGRGCTIMGREIGKALVNLSKKIVPNDEAPTDVCIELVNNWAAREINLALANGKDAHVAIIQDKRECLIAVLESSLCSKASSLRHLLGVMFDTGNLRITLATGHKAKGLEWPVVLHLDPWRVPSKYAVAARDNGNPVPYEQDLNLKYVIETRSKSVLIFAGLEEMQ